jgi:hypothetical protein
LATYSDPSRPAACGRCVLDPEALKTTTALGASMVGLFLIGLTGIVSSAQPQIAVGALIAGTALATIVPLVMTGRTPWSS